MNVSLHEHTDAVNAFQESKTQRTVSRCVG